MSEELLQGFYLGDFLIEPLKGLLTNWDELTVGPARLLWLLVFPWAIALVIAALSGLALHRSLAQEPDG